MEVNRTGQKKLIGAVEEKVIDNVVKGRGGKNRANLLAYEAGI